MKRYLAFLILLLFPLFTWCQVIPWQQLRINVQLHEEQHQLKGFMELNYHNTSSDSLTYIWLQLPPTVSLPAYTAYIEAELLKKNAVPYFAKAEDAGKISQLAFNVNGVAAKMLPHPKHADVLQLQLPHVLLPGDSIRITTPFEVQLTGYLSRTDKGHRAEERFRLNSNHHNFALLPVPGFNYYDKFMLGAVLFNHWDTTKNLHYLLLPMYAFGSKQLTGAAAMSYKLPLKHPQREWKLALQYASFTTGSNKFQDAKFNYRTQRLLPELTYTIQRKKPLETIQTSFRYRPYIIREENYSSFRLIEGADTSYQFKKQGATRYLNQLQIKIANNRTLYPWEIEFLPEQMKGLIKLGVTGKYYFNYNASRGLSTRVFLGKMWQTGSNQQQHSYNNRRYNWNLSAATGNQDYTYSNYFIGRSEFDGLLSQQTVLKDGAFKVSTPLLNNKIGSTDNWLTAINLVTDVPDKFNPTSLFPITLPIKLFADIGTTATAWEGNKTSSGSRLYYDAGIQLSLLKSSLNIYIPVLYSKQFRDYYKSVYGEKVFWKTITFSLDIQDLRLKKHRGSSDH